MNAGLVKRKRKTITIPRVLQKACQVRAVPWRIMAWMDWTEKSITIWNRKPAARREVRAHLPKCNSTKRTPPPLRVNP